uniref:Uncharacterized protein n=1 Tax=Tanacetum cinerariifolium TaxID=118510 RepID=A0A699HE13_TANCI|nr:hypothetical protein [Tanacetum cinerariifolium]
MDPNTIVLNIGSDEEDANWVNDDVIKGINVNDHNWIIELLNKVKGGSDVNNGSDEVPIHVIFSKTATKWPSGKVLDFLTSGKGSNLARCVHWGGQGRVGNGSGINS